MNNSFLEDIIHEQTLETVYRLLETETINFVEQVDIAGLNKKKHFRYSDLRGVCFDNSDLRGFDFRGADLQGATGKNVYWDKTTNLTGADVTGSVFAYELGKKAFFDAEPKWHSLFLRKQKEYWTNNINWFADRLAERSSDQPYLVEVAKAICDTTEDAFLRSQLLLSLAPTFSSSSQHRDFLIHNLARHYDDKVSVRSTIRVMSSLYGSDPIIFEILQRELTSDDYTIREAAIRGIVASKHFRGGVDKIGSIVRGFGPDIRRMYVRRAAESFNSLYINAVTEPSGNAAIDFLDVITEDKIEKIARARLISEGQKRVAGRKTETGEPMQPKISDRQVRERTEEYRNQLRLLQKYGVPFVFMADQKPRDKNQK